MHGHLATRLTALFAAPRPTRRQRLWRLARRAWAPAFALVAVVGSAIGIAGFLSSSPHHPAPRERPASGATLAAASRARDVGGFLRAVGLDGGSHPRATFGVDYRGLDASRRGAPFLRLHTPRGRLVLVLSGSVVSGHQAVRVYSLALNRRVVVFADGRHLRLVVGDRDPLLGRDAAAAALDEPSLALAAGGRTSSIARSAARAPHQRFQSVRVPLPASSGGSSWLALLLVLALSGGIALALAAAARLRRRRSQPPSVFQPRVGAELAGHRLLERLSVNGFSGVEVYAAEAPGGGQVAIKLGPVGYRRLEAEAGALARLDHPALVKLLREGTLDGWRYLVLPLLGPSLETHLTRGDLRGADALGVLLDVFDGLAYLHRQGIVHRDVKPANVLVQRGGERARGLLIDLNAAHCDDLQLTQVGEFVGTPQYAAPEQVLRLPVTPASDVYAACVVAYELLAGRAAYALSPSDVAEQRLPGEVVHLGRLRPDLAARLVERVMQGLAHNPAVRPMAAGLCETLRVALDGEREGDTRILRPRVPTATRIWGSDPVV